MPRGATNEITGRVAGSGFKRVGRRWPCSTSLMGTSVSFILMVIGPLTHIFAAAGITVFPMSSMDRIVVGWSIRDS